MFSRLNSPKQQTGQSIIFVVLFLGVVVLSLVFLYKAGKVTSEKMQVQNAADAAAYSVSITEARDLNFMSYTNRAMVANEVAIGQMVGMASWATHWSSFESYLMAYERLFVYPLVMAATLGTSGDAVENVFKLATNLAFKVPGDFMFKVFKIIGNIGATVMHYINKAYSAAQTGYHYGSILYSLSAYIDLVNDNAPGAKISDFGILSMIAHTFTFAEIPGVPGSFVKTYNPSTAEHVDGFQRLAAHVNGSRDEWSRKRGWTLPLDIPPFPIDFDSDFDNDGDVRFNVIDIGVAQVWMEFIFQLSFDLEKTGASELRAMADELGNQYNWSSADATSVLMNLVFHLGAGVTVLGADFGASVDLDTTSGTFARGAMKLNLPSPIDDVELFDIDLPFPTSAPFSSGSAQIGRTKVTGTDLFNISADGYGGAPNHSQAWGMDPSGTLAPPFVGFRGPVWSHLAYQVPTVIATMPTTQRRINTSYRGLPMYSDTEEQTTPWGYEAPYFLAGVVKDAVDIYSNNAPLTDTTPACIDNTADATTAGLSFDNAFHLNDGCIADGELGAIAKSEVYFSRPLDLAYFGRADDQEEYGSAFNPYWQARLVQTTNADRMVAIALQQKQTFGTIDSIADLLTQLASIPDDIMSLF
ncbi:MAG: hypothetical protein HND53_04470 [Proteobacteria bacterium]|nr:hypothetical protein [Pseudomonadota bacterium]NOG59732.1 hypothetical protein [Pseudomonadota bacterium]